MARWSPLRCITIILAVSPFNFSQSCCIAIMITRKVASASALFNILFFPFATCHMELSWPYPLRSKYNAANSYEIIDYSMTSPLNADGSNFPCKGYQNDRPIQTTATYMAGSTYNMTLAGSATHGGGSCQLSLSYDNGATFRVIQSMIGGCPLTSTYDFTIPSYAPAGSALFAWTWQNYEGNREFYMNCAEVNIEATSTSRRKKRQTYTAFDQLPYLWKANLEGMNDCVTTEGENPVYPNPGPEVLYGDGMTSSIMPSLGYCDSPTPYGQTYKDLGDSEQPVAADTSGESAAYTTAGTTASSSASISTEYPTFSYAPLTTAESTTAHISDYDASTSTAYPTSLASNAHQRQAAASVSYSTTTITIDCPSSVTVTVYPSASTSTLTITPRPSYYTTVATASACTGTSASCPCARDYQCQELDPCTWTCNAFKGSRTWHSSIYSHTTSRTWTTSRTTHSTVVRTTTHTVVPVPASETPGPSPAGHPPYATGDVERYLPCVPGTFICTDDTTWDTCNYGDGSNPDTPSNAWVYGYPRNVSAGMECITYLSPYSSGTSQYAQQALTSHGYYRDDRIVRARPDGDCDDPGSIKCIDDGQQFEVCDQGGWVAMGPVAAGTTCSNGEIVPASR